ncbi:CoA transferase [Vineibacter terrae]|uniref:CaiB/BaiF CoA transferase family protein n=1 Tax=Vineibacter terrae TaxID=2586908 RepID=UPI002E326624|nr:CoA transferase [Vineibacter terrae]HEX2890951.1 CoA transferase [Vineibacter terrae]
MSYDAPLRGIKVVDLSQGLAGPYCATLLAQNGADVIKVEPIDGDWSRILGVSHGGHTAFSIAGNLGKRSVALDLKSDAGKSVLWRLLDGADVLIEGFRPGVMARLGFDYGAVSARAPRILYVSVSGFGQDGPLAARPAMDPVLQAYTGLTLENRDGEGIPRRVPISIVDMTTALYAFQALSSALYARRDQAAGRHIEVSLLQSAACLQTVRLLSTRLEARNALLAIPPSGSFQTADGWVQIQIVKDADWARFCAALGAPEMSQDERFRDRDGRAQHHAALYAALRPIFRAQATAGLLQRFTAAEILHERLNTYDEFLAHEHVTATGAVAWLRQDGVQPLLPVPNIPGTVPLADGAPRATSPACGAHTHAVLLEHGYSGAEIADLASRGVVGGPLYY